jgi:uncharacterized protein DUF4331
MQRILKPLVLGVALIAGAGCTHNSAVPTPRGPAQYQQIERLARPAIKEAFQNWQNHDATNRSAPTNDAGLQQAIVSFATTLGRDANHANTLAAILIPDEIQADLSKTVGGCGTPNAPCAAYLGHETGGATGSTFGGRWLNDDTIKVSLNVIFGSTLSDLGLIADDHQELWCLSDDNLATGSPVGQGTFQTYGATFPYVNTPY